MASVDDMIGGSQQPHDAPGGRPAALPLPVDDYFSAVRREAALFAESLGGANWTAPVPMSDEWTLAGLTRHLGRIHRWAAAIVATGVQQPLPAAPETDADLPAWFVDGADLVASALEGADPLAPCWSFAPPATAGFWVRRMAHETAVHRVDAHDAVGDPTSVDAILAADGVDELFSVAVPRSASKWDESPRLSAVVLLSATDTGHTWRVTDDPQGRHPVARLVDPGHSHGAAATLSGTASDLLLTLWGRRAPATLTHHGDAGAADVLFTGRLTN